MAGFFLRSVATNNGCNLWRYRHCHLGGYPARMRYALAAVILAVTTRAAVAAPPYEGSWAGSQANCSSPNDGNLRIVGKQYYEHEGTCSNGSTKGFKGTWALFLTCEGEGEQWKKVVTLEPMGLEPMGDKMRLGGDRGPVLQRCRKSARPPNWPQ
jgi:hypothetical protein